MSPSMFRNSTIQSPLESFAVRDATEKIVFNFVRSHANKVDNNHLSNRTLREALGQLDGGFKNAFKNNLIRLFGKEYYNENTRDLDDSFSTLVDVRADTTTEYMLSLVNDELEKGWTEEAGEQSEKIALLKNRLEHVLNNAWNTGHVQFKKDHANTNLGGDMKNVA